MGEKVCPNCRMPLPENARFCAECGSRIDITVTRKELDESSLGVESGLKIERNAAITSPFYEKCDSLKDKIVNPELKPLPEKRSLCLEVGTILKIALLKLENWNSAKRKLKNRKTVGLSKI